MVSIWQKCHVKRIKKYHWFNRYVNADGREKVKFCQNVRNRYVRVRTYNARKYLEKTCRWKFNARNCVRKISFLRKFLFFTCVNVRRKKTRQCKSTLRKIPGGGKWQRKIIARVKCHFYPRFYFLLTLNVCGQKRDSENPTLASKKNDKTFVTSKFFQWSHQINMLEPKHY